MIATPTQSDCQRHEPADRCERLDSADLWLRDGLRLCDPPGFFQSLAVDMTRCRALLNQLRGEGLHITYPHVLVRAVALALSRNPELHQLLIGGRRLFPGTVDIGLSVSGTTVVAPVLVIRDAGRKGLREITHEVIARVDEARDEQQQFLAKVRRWGWLVPFGWLRRAFLRPLWRQFVFRRQGVGTFQVSCVPTVDQFVPFLFATAAIVGAGRVRERVVAVNGRVEVRHTVILSCCADHKVWDGACAATFLNAVSRVLDSDELAVEVSSAANQVFDNCTAKLEAAP